MKVYEQISPDSQAAGAVFIGYLEAMGIYKPLAVKQLEDAGIGEISINEWYPRQVILDILKEIDMKGGTNSLFFIGKKMADNTNIPQEIKTFEGLIVATPLVYPMYNRNLGEGDYMKAEVVGKQKIRFIYYTPYPTQAIKGWLTQIFRKFHQGKDLTIELEGNCQEDDYGRIFVLSW